MNASSPVQRSIETVYRHESVSLVLAGGETDAVLGTFDVCGRDVMYVDLTTTGDTLSGFSVEYRAHENAQYQTVAEAAADYTTPIAPVVRASGDLTIAAVGDHALILDVRGIESVRLLVDHAGESAATVVADVGSS